MQLNPARGRKPECGADDWHIVHCAVYAAQPREGTETLKIAAIPLKIFIMVYAAQPREGTETF